MTSIEDIIRRIFREEIRAALQEWEAPSAPAESGTDLLDTAAAAAALGAAEQTLANWRSKHTGPPFVKVGSLARYRREDLEQWMAGRSTPAVPTAASSASGSARRP